MSDLEKTNLPSASFTPQSWQALGLETWSPAHPLPATAAPSKLAVAKANLERALAPATQREYAVAMAGLADLAEAFNIQVPNPKKAFAIYAETLAKLPPDLLMLSIKRARETWKWGNRLPMPADLLALVSSELKERRTTLANVRLALLKRPETQHKPKEKPISIADAMERLRTRFPTSRNSSTAGQG